MINIITKKLKIVVVAIFLVGSTIAVLPLTASASVKDDICSGASLTPASPGDCTTGVQDKPINDLATKIINILSVIVGIVAVVMVLVGGYKYVTSGGDTAKVSSAKSTILYALIGIALVAISQFLVKFVFNAAENSIDPPSGP